MAMTRARSSRGRYRFKSYHRCQQPRAGIEAREVKYCIQGYEGWQWLTIRYSAAVICRCGAMVAQLIRNQSVVGSSPIICSSGPLSSSSRIKKHGCRQRVVMFPWSHTRFYIPLILWMCSSMVEHKTFNLAVDGSSPFTFTTRKKERS